MKVIHLVRGIGPTSMPWNDLYATGRNVIPGSMYPPAVIGFGRVSKRLQWLNCREQRRRYLSSNPLCGLVYIWKLYRRSVSRGDTLILHIHNPMLSLIGLFARILCPSIRIVGNLHTDWRFLKLRHRLGLYLLLAISNRFVGVSCASISSIPKSLRKRMLNAGRLVVIHNGIDIQSIGQAVDGLMNYPDTGQNKVDEVVAVVVARMVPAKNCLFIINLLAKTPSIDRLIWLGDGPQKTSIESEIQRLGVGSRVTLLGNRQRREVFQILSQATLYISASRWEGIGVANLEAAALGCWPFLSRIPAHEEVAEILGLSTCSIDDLDEWVMAINNFLALPFTEQDRLRFALSEKARSSFDLNKTVNRYIAIYKHLAT